MEAIKNLIHKALTHAGFMKYFKNTLWLFGGQVLKLVLGLVVTVAIARYFGPKDFGLYCWVLSIIALIDVVAQLGLKQLAKRELVEQPEKRDVILGTCFVLSFLAGVIAYAAILLTVWFISDRSLLLSLFALFGGILFLSPLNFIEIWFQSQVRSDLSVCASSIALLLFAAVKIIAIYYDANLLHFGYILLFEATVLTGLLVFFYRRHFGRLHTWRAEHKLAYRFLKQSWPLLLSSLAVATYVKIDQVMLGSMLGDEEVGQYSVAAQISSVFYFIPVMLATSLFPAIMNARKQSVALYEDRIQRYFDLNAGIAYMICVPLTLLSPWLIYVLFGPDYEAAAPILAVHVWSSLFVFLGVARAQYLLAEKMFKFAMFCTLAGAIVNVAMNYALIPIYGGMAAAVTTLVSYLIAGFLSSAFLPRSHSLFKRQLLSLVVPLKILNFKNKFGRIQF